MLSVGDCKEAIATAPSQALHAIDLLDLETAKRYQSEITGHISHRVDLQFDQIRAESTAELQAIELCPSRSLFEAEFDVVREWISLKSHSDPTFHELHESQIRELGGLDDTLQITFDEQRRKRVRNQELANHEARQSARNDDFQAAWRLNIDSEFITDEKLARREISVRKSIDGQKAELLIRHQNEVNRIISRFDRTNEAFRRAFRVKKDFSKAVQILKQKAVVRCQVLETHQNSINHFTNQIITSIDDSVKHCLTSRNDEMDQTRQEAMRANP
jgi:hypothetical protein